MIEPQGGEDKYGRELDDLRNLNYQGDTIRVLCWNAQQPEFDIESVSSDNIRNALFDRNGEVERRLNVDLTFRQELGDTANVSNFTSKVDQAKKANTKEFDIIAAYSRTAGQLAVRGYLEDLADVQDTHLNFSKPYWPDNMVNELKINNSLYFISGDISPNLLYMMQVIYFNKDMLDQYWEAAAKQGHTVTNGKSYTAEHDANGKLIASPATLMLYDWAYAGDWTIDKLIALSRGADGTGIYRDNNGNGVKDSKDTYGFTSRAFQMNSFYTSSGLRFVEQTTDGSILKISDDYGSEKTAALLSKLGAWINHETIHSAWATVDDDDYYSPFSSGRTMFFAVRAEAPVVFGDKGAPYDYGILPVPMYDEAQESYHTCLGNPFTMYSIFNGLATSGSASRTGRGDTLREMTAVLECWASETYRLVTPEVYEVITRTEYGKTSYDAKMFDLCCSSATFDLGQIFAFELDTMSEKPFNAACNGQDWNEYYNETIVDTHNNLTLKQQLKQKIETLVSWLY